MVLNEPQAKWRGEGEQPSSVVIGYGDSRKGF